MVINCDHMTDPAWAAKIIQKAFQKKFAGRPQK
jgi:hypothetical protein